MGKEQDGPQNESRRLFLRQGVLFVAGAVARTEFPVGVAAVSAYKKVDNFLNPFITLTNEAEILQNSASTNLTKPYGIELVEGHRYVIFGDSNAEGNVVDDVKVSYPAPQYITERMKDEYDWDIKNYAVRRSTSGATLAQIRNPDAVEYLKRTKHYDIYLGVGGNNPRTILEDEDKRKEILWLKDHPKNNDKLHNLNWTVRAASMAHTVVDTMNTFENDLNAMMDHLHNLKKSGNANGLHRIFVLGLPDISQIPKITIYNDKGEQTDVQIAGTPVARFIRNIEIGMINRALNVVTHHNAGFNGNVHFLNPFTIIGPKDLREIHLNQDGQEKMGHEQARRSAIGGGKTLLDLMAA